MTKAVDQLMEPVFSFPGIVGMQGGKKYYSVCIPFRALARLLAIDIGNTMDRSQRDVDLRRATAVKQYIQDNPTGFVLPSLTGVVDEKDLTFTEHLEGSCVGTITMSMEAEIKLFDGQHRASGIMALVKEHSALAHNTIPVVLFANMDLQARQQAFSDINGTAKNVSASLNAAYDHRDISGQRLARMANQVSGWAMQIEWEKASCAGKSEKIFPFKAIMDASRLLLGKGKRDEISEADADFAAEFWDKVSHAAGWRNRALVPDHSCIEGRDSFITYHVIGLKALALWGRQVIEDGQDLDPAIERLTAQKKKMDRYANHWQGKCTDDVGRMISDKEALIAVVKYLCLITEVKPSTSLE